MAGTLPLTTDSSAQAREPQRDGAVRRLSSQDLLGQQREVEIEHQGRIYRLRLTSLNKLILTA